MADNFNISPDMIDNIVNMLKNTNSNSVDDTTDDSTPNGNESSIDFDTILKIKSVMDAMNSKNDPRSNLLYSLKPYLRESKRSKLDQYANILKITQVTGLFKNEKEN